VVNVFYISIEKEEQHVYVIIAIGKILKENIVKKG